MFLLTFAQFSTLTMTGSLN